MTRGASGRSTEIDAEGKQPPPTLVFIEEAHEFLSAHRIIKMKVVFQQVAGRSGSKLAGVW